jgi:DNA ligase (NAD+)
MEGLSESTLEKFIDMGFIKNYRDMFHLDKYEEAIIGMEGFGEKSYANIIASVDASRNTTLARLLYGLGIENIGVANAKMIAAHFDYDLDLIRRASLEELSAIEGVGDVIARSIRTYFDDEKNKEALEALLPELNLVKPEKSADSDKLKGLTFVITGSLNGYENRDELKNKIEEMGGKVAGSVSKNTECLINNDATSNSSKNKKAKELGVKILTEEEFEEEYFS